MPIRIPTRGEIRSIPARIAELRTYKQKKDETLAEHYLNMLRKWHFLRFYYIKDVTSKLNRKVMASLGSKYVWLHSIHEKDLERARPFFEAAGNTCNGPKVFKRIIDKKIEDEKAAFFRNAKKSVVLGMSSKTKLSDLKGKSSFKSYSGDPLAKVKYSVAVKNENIEDNYLYDMIKRYELVGTWPRGMIKNHFLIFYHHADYLRHPDVY